MHLRFIFIIQLGLMFVSLACAFQKVQSHLANPRKSPREKLIYDTSFDATPSYVIAKRLSAANIASTLGYFMGSMAVALYMPIIVGLLKKSSAEGTSLATWVTSLASFSLALIYPIKKKFALSTYIELIALECQSFIIVCIICKYKNMLKELFLGTFVLGAIVVALLTQELSPSLLSSIQILRVALDGYSLLPQIIMNWNQKAFSYNEITALMSAVGNGIRIFTTFQLVKDPLVLIGYIIGFLSNSVLLLQYFYFKGLAK